MARHKDNARATRSLVPHLCGGVRNAGPANRTAAPSQIEQSARPEPSKPLQILTVAVDPETARSLVELAVESEYEIWVSLAPLVEPEEGVSDVQQ